MATRTSLSLFASGLTAALLALAGPRLAAEPLPWPGGGEGQRIDITQPGMGDDLSGASWNEETQKLWVVSNNGIFWRMSQSDPNVPDSWVIDTAGPDSARWVIGGDAEAITQADWSEERVYVGIEQPSREIQEYDVSALGVVNRVNTWILDAEMGSGDNSGLEALTFVPDSALAGLGFVDQNGAPYPASVYGTGGLFFAGRQSNGHIYVFDLDRNSADPTDADYTFVGEYSTGQSEIAALEFDRSLGTLYSYHNYGIDSGLGSDDELQALKLAATGAGPVKSFPLLARWIGPRIDNNEGIALGSGTACGPTGGRNFFLTTDDGGADDSLGIYPAFPCTYTVCRIELSQPTYTVGDDVTADAFVIANPSALPLPVEWKVWLRAPSGAAVGLANRGADGSFSLPLTFATDIGPITLFSVTALTPAGDYELGCRMLDPVTGAPYAEHFDAFEVL